MSVTLTGFAILLLLIFARFPLAIAMGIVGVGGFAYVQIYDFGNPNGDIAAMNMIAQVAFDQGLSYSLSVVPLFILMGNFITESGLSRQLYSASHAFLGHYRGGLALSTVVSCGAFSAVCGSSMATAATISKVAMPSMRQYKYDDGLASGAIAAGGTLGILIPPSVILVIYGIMTETDIGKLFIAGILPGFLGIVLYMLAVTITVNLKPSLGPAGEKSNWKVRLRALKDVWMISLLFIIVMGGIYTGHFTPTEAAGIGAMGAFIIALLKKTLSFSKLYHILFNTAKTTAMLFIVVIGAEIFSNFVNIAGFPEAIQNFVAEKELSFTFVVVLIILIYLVLGCVLESLSMILLTVPVFYPLISSMGGDLIWFGILVVVVTEISLITPPVGLNVFVLKSVLPDVKLSTIFRGVTPFWISDILRLILIATLPIISLFLVNIMG